MKHQQKQKSFILSVNINLEAFFNIFPRKNTINSMLDNLSNLLSEDFCINYVGLRTSGINLSKTVPWQVDIVYLIESRKYHPLKNNFIKSIERKISRFMKDNVCSFYTRPSYREYISGFNTRLFTDTIPNLYFSSCLYANMLNKQQSELRRVLRYSQSQQHCEIAKTHGTSPYQLMAFDWDSRLSYKRQPKTARITIIALFEPGCHPFRTPRKLCCAIYNLARSMRIQVVFELR